MMSDWKECTIGEIASVKGGKRLPKGVNLITEQNAHPYIRIRDLTEKTLELKSSYEYVDNETQKCISRYIVGTGDILISIVGTIGLVAVVGESLNGANLTENCVKLIDIREDVDREYLYYFLVSNMGQDEIRKGTVGAVQPKLPIKNIQSIKLYLPHIDIQKRISGLLSAIDCKIAQNTAINENLEQQVQALCEKWVSEHAESIIMRPLSELAEINPDTYSPKEKWRFVNYLDTSSITNGVISEIQMINPDTDKLPSRARRIVKANDIVYSTVRPNQLHFGIISNPMENMLASTGFAVIRSKYTYISSPYLYHFLTSSDFIEKMQQLAEQSTSTFPSVKPSDIGTCMIPYADKEELLEITEQINNMYAMISANHQENQRLSALRDTLLPKLMNGEIDVSAVKI